MSFIHTVNTRVIPIWNTMGVIPGHIKNEVVVVGNHRDGMRLFIITVDQLNLFSCSMGHGCHRPF